MKKAAFHPPNPPSQLISYFSRVSTGWGRGEGRVGGESRKRRSWKPGPKPPNPTIRRYTMTDKSKSKMETPQRDARQRDATHKQPGPGWSRCPVLQLGTLCMAWWQEIPTEGGREDPRRFWRGGVGFQQPVFCFKVVLGAGGVGLERGFRGFDFPALGAQGAQVGWRNIY